VGNFSERGQHCLHIGFRCGFDGAPDSLERACELPATELQAVALNHLEVLTIGQSDLTKIDPPLSQARMTCSYGTIKNR